MHYIEVLPAEASFHGKGALTYSADQPLVMGSLVVIPLRSKKVMGVVTAVVSQPTFAVKPITEVISLPPLPSQLIELLDWLKTYYPAPLGIITQLAVPRALPKKPLASRQLSTVTSKHLPALTAHQKQALALIRNEGLHLLHGETGTGKTRVYIELAKQALQKGESALILTPEIGLTSQLVDAFSSVFGERVIVLHSRLSDTVRRQNWQYLLEHGEPMVVIGARSALFSPLQNLGLIAIDEAHETAYKQDQAPYYHTTTVAAKLASLHKAQLIVGSATPLVSDYYIASAKQRPIIKMTETASKNTASMRTLEVIDLKDRGHFTRSPHVSNDLIARITASLQSKEQVLLFLNRRGTARVVFCEKCSWQAACPHCDLPLIYHGDIHLMRCHSCDFKAPAPTSCPECRNTSVVYKTVGTKAIVEEINKLFPEAKVMRFDTDNKLNERIEQHFNALHTGEVNILIGTQTVAKGLDLPKLSLVGIIVADSSLNFPDFSAQERTYELLSQVIGRVGRGHRNGHVVLQTYTPDSPLIQSVISNDWDSFYNKELDERRKFLFPPFCYLLKLTCKRSTSSAAERSAAQLANDLRNGKYRIIVEGPAPSFHEKTQNKFAWQLIIKATDRTNLTRIISELPSGWTYDIDPMNLL